VWGHTRYPLEAGRCTLSREKEGAAEVAMLESYGIWIVIAVFLSWPWLSGDLDRF
jgi:hypothetical protein